MNSCKNKEEIKLLNLENCLLIKNVEFFMNKKFFERFFYESANNYQTCKVFIIEKNFLPLHTLFSFSNKETKEKFFNEYQKFEFSGSKLVMILTDKFSEEELNSYIDFDESRIFRFPNDYFNDINFKYERSSKEDGLIYKDAKILDAQSKVLSYLVKKFGSNLLKGESIMNISLPVAIFDQRSLLQV